MCPPLPTAVFNTSAIFPTRASNSGPPTRDATPDMERRETRDPSRAARTFLESAVSSSTADEMDRPRLSRSPPAIEERMPVMIPLF